MLAGDRVMAVNPWQHFPKSLGLKDGDGKAVSAAPGQLPRNDRPSAEVSDTCVQAMSVSPKSTV
jgi:hypothetical protein